MPTHRHSLLVVAALLAIAAGLAVSLAAAHEPGAPPPGAASAGGWRGLAGAPQPRVALGRRAIVLLRAPSLAERVRQAGGVASDADERRWTAAALADQERLLRRLRADGLSVAVEHRFARVVNGFSAVLDSGASAALERRQEVRGVYPVRAAYPAAIERTAATAAAASPVPVGLDGFAGRGVTIALLDTGVVWATPYLRERVLPGIDVVDGTATARARTRPGSPDTLERHGTEMAGILVGQGGEGGPFGLVPEATVLPIRVAGWQRDAVGRWSLSARSDQILAGLELAVDPNGDGDAHDAVPIALVPLVEPRASFSDGPLPRAAQGALALGTLVIAPAGNDGGGGPVFGDVGAPAGAPAALAVGAADLRPLVADAAVTVRSGLTVLLRRRLSLLSAVPPRPATLELVAAPAGRSLDALFARDGLSRVAGRAVFVPAGGEARAAVRRAVQAGAALVLVAGRGLPAGALGLDRDVQAPVLAAPARLATDLRAAARAGTRGLVSIGRIRVRANPERSRVAAFSSHGPGIAGQPKPDLVAAGVGVTTTEPGVDGRGASRSTVSGSSVAAAVAAGAAARLIEARPALSARAIASALTGAARLLPGQAQAAQGSGLLDAGRAARLEVVSEPAALFLGRATEPGWQASRRLRLWNVSPRSVAVRVGVGRVRHVGLVVEVEPRRLRLAPGEAAWVRVTARAVGLPAAGSTLGTVTVTPEAGPALRVPWAAVLGRPSPRLLGRPRVVLERVRPARGAVALLVLDVAQMAKGGEAIARLEVERVGPAGERLVLLARPRELLPGRSLVVLSGRAPGGRALAPGRYLLRIAAYPAAGGGPVERSVAFQIE